MISVFSKFFLIALFSLLVTNITSASLGSSQEKVYKMTLEKRVQHIVVDLGIDFRLERMKKFALTPIDQGTLDRLKKKSEKVRAAIKTKYAPPKPKEP